MTWRIVNNERDWKKVQIIKEGSKEKDDGTNQ